MIAGNDSTSTDQFPKVDMAHAASLRPSRLRGTSLMIMVNVVAGVAFILFGFDQGVLSALLTLPAFINVFPQTAAGFNGPHAATLQSFLVASYLVGCFFGALVNIWLGDKIGRKKSLIYAGIGVIIGTGLQAGAVDYAMMIVARIFTGVFNGLLTSTIPTYQSECAKPHRRGQLLLFSGSLITFGIMCAYWINLGFYFVQGQAAWRVPIALQCVFTFAMLILFWTFRLPESPRWLAAQGRHAECIAVLAALDGLAVDDPAITKIWHGIVDAVNQSAGEFSLGELITHGKSQHFRRTLLGIGAQCFQQITGINLITYYLTSVLTQMGIGPVLSRILSGVNGTCYFLTSIIAVFIVEKVGRRPLMIWTALAMGLTMILLAGLYNTVQEGNKGSQGVSVLCLFLFNTWFSIGWLGMTWLYPAEVTPLRIRAPANALSTASNWLFNFFVVMVTGPMFANIRWGTYAFFGSLNLVIILPGVILFFPETKKYSLEELDLIFAIAHEEGVSPVKISLRGDIPEAGSPEAEAILGGRRAPNPDLDEKSGGGKKGGRFSKGDKGEKGSAAHTEDVSRVV